MKIIIARATTITFKPISSEEAHCGDYVLPKLQQGHNPTLITPDIYYAIYRMYDSHEIMDINLLFYQQVIS
jgi:hypothetical protein